MFFSSVALSLMAPALCLGIPLKNLVAKKAPAKFKMPCNNASSFSLLTYNVAGLPEIINQNGIKDKKLSASYIGQYIREQQYDVVHLQEDFHFHDVILNNDNHTYHTPSSGEVIDGDGLNTLSHYNASHFARFTWKECSVSGGDCLTPKGFTHMISNVDGFEVDLYNLHADAGNQWDDRLARREGLDQLLHHIKNHNKNRPVILAGDFNDLWTCSKRSIDLLIEAGFTDAWVELHHNNTIPEPNGKSNSCAHPPKNNSCEVVDKVFYRSSKSVTLNAYKFNYESDIFAMKDNSQPSDHVPLRVDFAWTRKEFTCPPAGKKPKKPKTHDEIVMEWIEEDIKKAKEPKPILYPGGRGVDIWR